MSKMSKVLLGAVAAWMAMAFLHATLNLGFSPAEMLGFGKKGAPEEPRFRVGFLPVT